MLDPSGKPTPRLRASTVREILESQLERLQAIPLDLMQHDHTERVRADAIAVAIEHLQQAIEALEIAARE